MGSELVQNPAIVSAWEIKMQAAKCKIEEVIAATRRFRYFDS